MTTKTRRKPFFREAMTIALPVALQAMLQSSFSMIDQLMVGQLGKTAIASVEIGSLDRYGVFLLAKHGGGDFHYRPKGDCDGGGLHANFGLYLPTVRDGLHLGRSYALLQLRPIPALHKCGGSRGQYGLELPLDFW